MLRRQADAFDVENPLKVEEHDPDGLRTSWSALPAEDRPHLSSRDDVTPRWSSEGILKNERVRVWLASVTKCGDGLTDGKRVPGKRTEEALRAMPHSQMYARVRAEGVRNERSRLRKMDDEELLSRLDDSSGKAEILHKSKPHPVSDKYPDGTWYLAASGSLISRSKRRITVTGFIVMSLNRLACYQSADWATAFPLQFDEHIVLHVRYGTTTFRTMSFGLSHHAGAGN